jgi:hypothetical protein
VREFVERAFACIGRTIEWRGAGVDEVGFDRRSRKELVRIDPRYFRPTEVDALLGDASKAHSKLGWRHRTTFAELVTEMVEADRKSIAQEMWRNDRLARKKPCDRGYRNWRRATATVMRLARGAVGSRHQRMVGAALVRRQAARRCEMAPADRRSVDLTRQKLVERGIGENAAHSALPSRPQPSSTITRKRLFTDQK